MELEQKLQELHNDLKSFYAKASDEAKNYGAVTAETKATIDAVTRRLDELEVKLATPSRSEAERTLEMDLKENESLQRLMRDGKGSATLRFKGGLAELQRKTTITTSAVGSATSGVLQYDRTPGIVAPARRKLFIRDLLTAIPTSFNAIDYVKVNSDIKNASPQTEASDKAENSQTFTTANATVKTLATWIPATRQILEDFTGLQGFLESSLMYSIRKVEEEQILIGDNTGQNLNGLTTQAASFDTSLLVAADGWEKVDIIGRAIEQVAIANEVDPSFVAMNPRDWWDIRLSKDSQGNYIFGPPNMPGPIELFGLTPIPTNALSSTKFLVGDSSPLSSVIRDRMDLEISISTEHSDYFVKNMVAVRAEERLALVVFRPNAFVYGTFNTSPA